MVKRLIIIFCIVFLCPMTVHAELSESEGKALLKEINKDMNRSANYETLMSVYSALKTTGFSDVCSAAILVNMNRESSIRPDAGQTGGSAIGLVQWDGGRRNGIQDYSKKMGDQKYSITVKGGTFKIGDIGTQVAYIMEEIENKGQLGGQGLAPGNANKYPIDLEAAKKQINDSSVDLSKKVSKEEWLALKSPVAASLYFTSQYERCAYYIDIYKEGAKQSLDMYKLITGTNLSNVSTDSSASQSIATAMVQGGFWDESQLASYCKLTEINIDEVYLQWAKREELTSKELGSLSNWEMNINRAEESKGLIGFLRVLVQLFGILFTIYALLLYLAYWFDRVNTLVDVDFLKILSFGRLVKAPDESECTFGIKEATNMLKDTQPQTVNHRAILTISLFSMSFGVLVVSGLFYQIIALVINKIYRFLK